MGLLCLCRLEACQNRASLHTPLPDASGYAAAPDLASVDGSAAVMTAGSATARSVSLAGRTCILTDSADKVYLFTCWHAPDCRCLVLRLAPVCMYSHPNCTHD